MAGIPEPGLPILNARSISGHGALFQLWCKAVACLDVFSLKHELEWRVLVVDYRDQPVPQKVFAQNTFVLRPFS